MKLSDNSLTGYAASSEQSSTAEAENRSGFAAQPASSVGSIGATDEQLEQMRENEYDSRANTR